MIRRALPAMLVIAGVMVAGSSAASGGPPVILRFTPTSGSPGTVVKITGSGLAGATSVTFAGREASSFSGSSKSIAAVVDAGTPSGPISVTTPLGTATSNASFTALAASAARITSLSPTEVPPQTAFTITGSGFLGTTSVEIDGAEAASFAIDSNTMIRAIAGADNQSGGVTVTTPAGTTGSPTPLSIVSAIDLGACSSSASEGLILPGHPVVLRDSWSMKNASYLPQFLRYEHPKLTLAGRLARSPERTWDAIGQPGQSGGWITYFDYDTGGVSPSVGSTLPTIFSAIAGAAIDDGYQVHPKKSVLFDHSCTIRVVALSNIAGTYPNIGPAGEPIYVDGDNLADVSQLWFGGIEVPFWHDGTALRMRIPVDAPLGSADITAREGSAATVTLGNAFDVTPSQPLTLHGVLPEAAGEPGQNVTLTGTGLFGVTSVEFGGTPAVLPTDLSLLSNTAMTVAIPDGAHTGQLVVSDGTTSAHIPFDVIDLGGVPDPTFGTNGAKLIDPQAGEFEDAPVAVALQSDDKPVVLGSDEEGLLASTVRPVLMRVDTDGTLDSTFGSGGIVVGDAPAEGYYTPYDLAIQTDGKILAAATAGYHATVSKIYRYLADGSLDPDFGDGGVVTIPLGQSGSDCRPQAQHLALQPDGDILVGGFSCDGDAVERLLPDGSVDTTFGAAGTAAIPMLDNMTAMIRRSDGEILIAGSKHVQGIPTAFVALLTASGSTDSGFGSNGLVTLPGASIYNVRAAGFDNAGNVIVSGERTQYASAAAAARLTPTGNVDASFASFGYLESGAPWLPTNIFATSDGGTLIIGHGGFTKLEADGTLDPKFGSTNYPGQADNNAGDWADGAIDSQGRLVTVGISGLADGFEIGRTIIQPTIIP